MSKTESQRMQCMEVWGGNRAVARSFETAGLRIWIDSKPFGDSNSGGDLYYVSSCASGRITRVVLADVCGHGEMVSQVALELRELVRRNVNYIKQTRFIRAMNRQFAALGERGGFATALVSTFFAPTKSFALCNAGHPAPLVYRQQSSEWSELTHEGACAEPASDTPLGVMEEATYCQRVIRLNTGDLVLGFSDAVTEAQDDSGRMLGRRGVLDLVRELPVTDPGRLIPSLVDRLRSLSEENLQSDDATLVLSQATGGGPSLGNSLLAPFRLLGSVSDRTQLR